MKGKIAIFLTILFISVGLRNVITIVSFYSNQAYIVENFCVNKQKPAIMCYGSCYLAKKLEKVSDVNGEKIPISQILDHMELKFVGSNDAEFCMSDVFIFKDVFWDLSDQFYLSNYLFEVFQPPEDTIFT